MASEKQLKKWEAEASKINDTPEYKQAYAKYKQLAKKADQRLVRLESYAHDKHYKNVLKYAYAGAIQDISKYGGGKRFNTKPPATTRQLERKIADIEKFMSLDTSTKQGIQKTYKARAKTLNKNYGTNFTWEEVANYWEAVGSGRFKYDPQEFRAYTKLRKENKKDADAILENSKKNVKIADDDLVQKEIQERLVESGLYEDMVSAMKGK